jgi:hypothetical protein
MTDKKSIQITKELADIIDTDGYVSSEVADNVFVKIEDGNKYSIAIPLPDSNNAYIIKLHNIIKISVSDDEYMHGDVDLVDLLASHLREYNPKLQGSTMDTHADITVKTRSTSWLSSRKFVKLVNHENAVIYADNEIVHVAIFDSDCLEATVLTFPAPLVKPLFFTDSKI